MSEEQPLLIMTKTGYSKYVRYDRFFCSCGIV